MYAFEIQDKSGRSIYLPSERWKHINREHPEVAPYFDDIQECLKRPLKITKNQFDENVWHYFKYIKERKPSAKHLKVIVKYLNNHGFIITVYFAKTIK